MKELIVVVGGETITFEGNDLKTIDYVSNNITTDIGLKGKLVIMDGKETIGVFSQYTYWKKVK